MPKILMIHEVCDELFELPLHDYILTFDDGLLSQYHYIDRIKQINTKKIFFITTGYVGSQNYMDLDQLRDILSIPNCELGGHSHSHTDICQYINASTQVKHIQEDTRTMLDWFRMNLGIRPTKYCFPFNKEFSVLHRITLRPFGFTEFYGRERIPVETLLHN